MKGMACVLFEAMYAAKQYEVESFIASSILETMQMPFSEMFNRFLTGTAYHYERRLHEMENVKALLESENLPSFMTEGCLQTFSLLKEQNYRARFPEAPPQHWEDVFSDHSLSRAKKQ